MGEEAFGEIPGAPDPEAGREARLQVQVGSAEPRTLMSSLGDRRE